MNYISIDSCSVAVEIWTLIWEAESAKKLIPCKATVCKTMTLKHWPLTVKLSPACIIYKPVLLLQQLLSLTLISSSLPHVISRMGKADPVDVSLFCLVAMDFYRHQIDEELDRRSFQSVFEMVASPGSPYYQLLCCLQSIHQDTSLWGTLDWL